jgi:LemA protein
MTIRALPQVVFLLVVFLLTTITGCQNYDTLVTKDQAAETAWADVEAQLQRRMDLVPNLVNTVKASAHHEEQTLKEVAEARASATSIKLSADDLSDPAKVAAFEKAQDNLKGSLSRLMMVNEQYPDLKANAAFHDLQVQLEGTENRILRSREVYNAAVGDYNTELGKIRGQAVNKITGKPFKPRVRFQAAAGAEKAPTVDFGK